jgi:quercetin dioxygenase-like cupin family protein
VASKFVDPGSLPTWTFDWGVIKPLVAGENTEGAAVSMMHVILLPGKGHDRHNHPDSDEILYILAGEGDQMVDDGAPQRVRPGDTVYIPKGAFHSRRPAPRTCSRRCLTSRRSRAASRPRWNVASSC